MENENRENMNENGTNNYINPDYNIRESHTESGSNDSNNNDSHVNDNHTNSNYNNSVNGSNYSEPNYNNRVNEYNNSGNFSNSHNVNDSSYNRNNNYNGNNYNGNNNYNNSYNGSYNNGYNGGHGGGNNKRMKLVAGLCGIMLMGVLLVMIGIYAVGRIDNLKNKDVNNDEIAWNSDDSDKGKDEAKTAEDKNDDRSVATTQPISVAQAGSSAAGVSDVSGIVEEVMPTVVSIISTASVKGYSIFGQEYEQEVSAGGTGFIVGKNDNELLIATNNHVVENSTGIQITFNDETTAEAVVKGSDADADLAVVSVKLEDLTDDTLSKIKVAVLGDSDKVKVGQMAIVIGNAKGMGQSVTVGYISAKDREIDIQDETTGKTRTMHYLQTDAAINGGNSGGPLLDVAGNVVGISSAKISDTQIEGMCYAIPISNAIPIINELMNRETLSDDEKGYIGVSLSDVDSKVVELYGVPAGAYVAGVMKKSPAEEAGIKEGDIITRINDTEIASSDAATSKITSCRAGTEITVTVCREAESGRAYEEHEFKITLASAKDIGINNKKDDSSKDKKDDSKEDEREERRQDEYDDYYGMDGYDGMFPW